MRSPPPRRCLVLEGTRAQTRAAARARVARMAEVLWVTTGRPEAEPDAMAPAQVRRRLGRAYDAVVVDLHDGVDADLLGQCHGFVWGGGALVLRLASPAGAPPTGRARLAVFPYGPEDVGARFVARLRRVLAERAGPDPGGALAPPPRVTAGTREQDAVVERLRRGLQDEAPSLFTLLADRGRGKSSALGRAVRGLDREVVISAAQPEATREIFQFATGEPTPRERGPVRFVPLPALASGEVRADVIVLDEAAQLPVPRLRQLVAAHPRAAIAFATTIRGYEGTGRGFVLRFLAQLRASPRRLVELTLEEPIRWSRGDPLEALTFDALLLDAEPGPAPAAAPSELVHEVLDPAHLAADEPLLRSFFGLLVHAHYRTTPSDLHRLLDAPNLRLHALRDGPRVAAASLVALEGGLPAARCAAMQRGETRIRGHALADTLVCHAGRADAGELRMVRSVRIATHPARRREGLAAALVERVHASYAPDLFGTLFGATPALLRFRRATGYELVRVGASRGARTGEPAAVMIRPLSAAARALLGELRADLARDLPLQLQLLGDLVLEPALVAALTQGLAAPEPLSDAAARSVARSYVEGPRPFESAAWAVTRLVERHRDALDGVEAEAVIRGRVLARRGWIEVAREAGQPSVPAAMRAMRRGLRALLERTEPG